MQVLDQRDSLVTSSTKTPTFENYQNAETHDNNITESKGVATLSLDAAPQDTSPEFPGVSQILSSLYLCGASVISANVIEQLDINFVINVAPELPDTPLPTAFNTLYLRINITDRPNADLSKHFDEVADMIEEVRQNGGKTLVHCVAGVSRSASLCLAYLIKYTGMNLKEAFAHVKNIRPQIRPNSGFIQQLRCYEEQRLGSISVKMVFFECLQREVPDVYEAEFQCMEKFYQKQRSINKRTQVNPLTT